MSAWKFAPVLLEQEGKGKVELDLIVTPQHLFCFLRHPKVGPNVSHSVQPVRTIEVMGITDLYVKKTSARVISCEQSHTFEFKNFSLLATFVKTLNELLVASGKKVEKAADFCLKEERSRISPPDFLTGEV